MVDTANADVSKRVNELTNGGADFAFEAVGNATVLATAYNCVRRGGTAVSVGLPHPNQQVSIQAVLLAGAGEERVRGSYMDRPCRRDVPRYMELYRKGLLPVDALVSPSIGLKEINVGFDRLSDGDGDFRQLIRFDGWRRWV